MGLMKKLKNRYFLILSFCFHEATLQADLARSVCAMDMVDSALKTLGLTLLKYDKSFGTLEQGYLASLSSGTAPSPYIMRAARACVHRYLQSGLSFCNGFLAI